MSDGASAFEPRRAPALRAELVRRATTMMADDGQLRAPGETAAAIIAVAARIAEEVTRRIDRVPEKQADNLLAAMGIPPNLARPARVPVAFQLTDPAPDGLTAPAATRLIAPGTSGAITFETEAAIALAPGTIAALVGVDAEADRIFLPPGGPTVDAQQQFPTIGRALSGGAGAGADKLQISPATGLAAGATLRIGDGPDAVQHKIAEVKDDLVTIDPPLDRTFLANTTVEVVTEFEPYAARDHQFHALYLGHDTLLNVPSELSITVQGVSLDEETEWSWWGGDPASWQPLVPTVAGASLILHKREGLPIAKEIKGHKSLWLRARLPGHPDRYRVARDIRLSVGGSGAGPKAKIVEAIANTTPLVLNSAFHPFGQEPRLFDSFYIGCAEAFSKAGARATLTFKVAGPDLESIAVVAGGGLVQVFGVGGDGLLYRAQFGKGQPRLVSIDMRRGPARVAAPPAHSQVAARLIGNRVHVAVAGGSTVYCAALPFEEPVDAASLDWKTVTGQEAERRDKDPIVVVEKGGKLVVLAQVRDQLLTWTDPEGSEPTKVLGPGTLVPIQGSGGAVVVGAPEKDGGVSLSFPDAGGPPVRLPKPDLAQGPLTAWSVPGATNADGSGQTSGTLYLAGYLSDGKDLRIAKIDLQGRTTKIIKPPPDALPAASPPIAFEPPPPPLAQDSPPTIVLAAETPIRLVWDGEAYMPVDSPPSIGTRKDDRRQIVATPGWIAVPQGNLGLLYRAGGANGEWTDEFLLSGNRVAVADNVPAGETYAAPDWQPNGNGFEILRPASGASALLRGSDRPDPSTACFFKDDEDRKDGRVVQDGKRVRLLDEDKFKAWNEATERAANLTARAASLLTGIAPLEKSAREAAATATAAQQANEKDKRSWDAAKSKTLADQATTERQDAQAELARLKEKKKVQDAARAAAVPSPSTPGPAASNDPATPGTAGQPGSADGTVGTSADGGGTAGGEADAPVTQKEIDDAEKNVTQKQSAEKAAQGQADNDASRAERPILDEAAAEAKWQASGDALKAANEASTNSANALTQARQALSDKQGERDEAVEEAKGAENYSIAVGDDPVVVRLFYEGEAQDPRRLWTLTQSAEPQWRERPADFPTANSPAGGDLRYKILIREIQLTPKAAIAIDKPEALASAAAKLGTEKRFHFASGSLLDLSQIQHFASPAGIDVATLAAPPGTFRGRRAELLTTDPEAWRGLGPVQPPNPALSWEYWNGTSWWALDAADMTDTTSNLLAEGEIAFTVPGDIGKSDVGGRENYWIRARLVGGDYGEAQVTVSSVAAGSETRQTVERDTSTIRAPYVTSFDVRFRVDDAVAPGVVLTEDSLGVVDQTQANVIALTIPVFTPLSDLMNPGVPPETIVSRAVMIGFEKPVRGDPVSLYVDVAPGGVGGQLVAEIYRGERFEPVQVRDDSLGLSEPGLIRLSLPVSPDQAELFDMTAYWLRLRPRTPPPGWSPRIRAVHLNAVHARSVETRELETLGHSAGTPNQRFALAGSPVESGSLELRVAEAVGAEDGGLLDVAALAGTKPGSWVRWNQVDDIDEADGAIRVFMLDANTGIVRFGDGRHGAIPPIGAELLAIRYCCVAGAAANEVAAGAALLLSSALSNIDRVTALDAAAGGCDLEAIDAARGRGTTKLRHGGRILTLADLEDYARASFPMLAQVRAANRGSAVQLVAAARGAEPRPAPAQLRALERSVREAAGYGVARPGGATVIAPRLLPVRVTLILQPDDPDRFIEMADAARAALVALFDPATGGLDWQGWPIGRAPTASDLAAALGPLSGHGSVSIGPLTRGDRSEPTAFPSSIQPDVLVRLEPNDISCERRQDMVA